MTESPAATDFVLTLTCPDQPGIVHAVSGFLVGAGANIVESQQYGDSETGRFFMRVRFAVASPVDPEELRASFDEVARRFSMGWELWPAGAPYRTLIMVSR